MHGIDLTVRRPKARDDYRSATEEVSVQARATGKANRVPDIGSSESELATELSELTRQVVLNKQ
jgi:hypothetical protein